MVVSKSYIPIHGPSPGFLALQLTILTRSACTVWFPLSILKVTFLIRNVHTSSQNLYVSRLPCYSKEEILCLAQVFSPKRKRSGAAYSP